MAESFSRFVSPFSWRYGSDAMRNIFSEEHKHELWRKIWVSVAQTQYEAGLLSKEELADLEINQSNLNLEEIIKIEKEVKHDVVAAIKEFAGKAKLGGGKIHLGMTSMDVVDNAEAYRVLEALQLIEDKLKNVLHQFKDKIAQYANVPCLGYTHLQPAEPTTVGYRFAFYAQDLLLDYELLKFIKSNFIKGKGFKGAVGTQASFVSLFKNNKFNISQFEELLAKKLGIDFVDISTQVAPRKIDYTVLTLLASITSSLAKFAGDLRILQSPAFGEWSEPFDEKQVGSSAMPFKKNPVNSEKICSLARMVGVYPQIALENSSLSYLERTLDDSANKRIIIPEAFLATDEILITAQKIIEGMLINKGKIETNLNNYAPFSATEEILMLAVKKGGNRLKIHDILRKIALEAWEEVQKGKENPMRKLLSENSELDEYISEDELKRAFQVHLNTGTAVERALKIAEKIKSI